MATINSKWVYRYSNWDECYTDINEKVSQKDLTLIFEHGKMRFVNGPTGYEAYYVEPYLINQLREYAKSGKDFCICGGTINSWPTVTVLAADVITAFDEAFGLKPPHVITWTFEGEA